MELFNVQRFYVNDGNNDVNTIENENHILQKLLSKVQRVEKAKPKDTCSDDENSSNSSTKNSIDEQSFEEDTNEQLEDISNNLDEDVEDHASLRDAIADNTADLVDSGFQILGDHQQDQEAPRNVNAILPPWLTHPVLIPINIDVESNQDAITQTCTNLPNLSYLHRAIREALQKMNITHLFPVQKVVIPWILTMHSKPPPFRPRDICVSAPTGSGKTLAFAIPIVQQLLKRQERALRALIVLPVTELAAQVYRVFVELTARTDIRVLLLSTQTPFQIEQSNLVEFYKNEYYSKIDILITTPGRLVDHIHGTKGFCLKSLKFLVIDEADRIMDEIFQNWLYHVHSHVRDASDQLLSGQYASLCWNELETTYDTQPHKLLFSATLSADPEKLQSLGLFRPKLFTSAASMDLNAVCKQQSMKNYKEHHSAISTALTLTGDDTVGRYITPAELKEKYCLTESRVKPLTLFTLIMENNWPKFLCFTNSVASSQRLTFVLKKLFQNKIHIAELSTNLKAKERAKILSSFSRGFINGIICSDALARGIDIPNIDIVISYDPPRHIRTYIHRIGRTARAGRSGTAITLLSPQEQVNFKKMLAEVGKTIMDEIEVSTAKEEQYANEYTKALKALREKVVRDKRYNILLKERMTAIPETISGITQGEDKKLSIMEKLQLQANEKIHETLMKENDGETLSFKKRGAKNKKQKKSNH